MCSQVHPRKLFAGANSGYGFFSLFYHIAGPRAEHIFLLKGGPGTGKSNLIQAIGEKMLLEGQKVELFYCSSDSDSLDAVYLPAIKTAVIDATAPHVMDPVHPGAVEEIINLGDCWHGETLKSLRNQITSINREKKHLFNAVYIYLSSALGFLSGIRQQYKESSALDEKGLSLLAKELTDDIEMRSKGVEKKNTPLERHLFVSALAPAGPVHHMESLIEKLEHVYLLQGKMGTGKRTLLSKIYESVGLLGLDREVFHCGLDPKRIEHIILPQLNIAIITSEAPHQLTDDKATRIFCTDHYCKDLPASLKQERHELHEMSQKSLDLACRKLKQTKEIHKEVEEIYTDQMDFALVDKKKTYIIEKIAYMLSR